MAYARLEWWEVTNFMAYDKAKAEMGTDGIIMFKGFNDSGKSAMLLALGVLFYNSHPTSQGSYIKDGKDYFRIEAHFADGVSIVKEKYHNGQSLYEMTGGEVEFSTRQANGVYAKVQDVPECIQKYLGVLTYEGTELNFRSCFEPQLLVQTKGTENYRLINMILHSEELAQAGVLLNVDKNHLHAKLGEMQGEMQTYEDLASEVSYGAEEVDRLKALESDLDSVEKSRDALKGIESAYTELKEKVVPPKADMLNLLQLKALCALKADADRLGSMKVPPKAVPFDSRVLDRLKSLEDMRSAYAVYSEKAAEENAVKADCDQVEKELDGLIGELALSGKKLVKCRKCGTLTQA